MKKNTHGTSSLELIKIFRFRVTFLTIRREAGQIFLLLLSNEHNRRVEYDIPFFSLFIGLSRVADLKKKHDQQT